MKKETLVYTTRSSHCPEAASPNLKRINLKAVQRWKTSVLTLVLIDAVNNQSIDGAAFRHRPRNGACFVGFSGVCERSLDTRGLR